MRSPDKWLRAHLRTLRRFVRTKLYSHRNLLLSVGVDDVMEITFNCFHFSINCFSLFSPTRHWSEFHHQKKNHARMMYYNIQRKRILFDSVWNDGALGFLYAWHIVLLVVLFIAIEKWKSFLTRFEMDFVLFFF